MAILGMTHRASHRRLSVREDGANGSAAILRACSTMDPDVGMPDTLIQGILMKGPQSLDDGGEWSREVEIPLRSSSASLRGHGLNAV